MKVRLGKILKRGRGIFLAYDQGLEHGPTDFNDKNVDPNYIIDIARRGKFSAVIFHSGIAEKYSEEIKKSKVPLIVKLDGKTNLVEGEPISKATCSVDEAVRLGASGVGYTIYIGSEFEDEMLTEFGEIVEDAHAKGIPVVAWIYPRGSGVKGKNKRELMAYAARVGLELGADIVKVQSTGKKEDVEWAVESAGKCKLVIAGGKKKNEGDLTKEIKDAMKVGCSGLAIGRNVWQAKDPLKISSKIGKLVFG
jgi:class I fructose-bisphosphate aldolase